MRLKKEILPEQLNYNKFPGPNFVHFSDQIKSEDGDIVFNLLIDNKKAFTVESFGQRFSELLLKYDFLVGDWSSEQLRIKGFYKEARKRTQLNGWARIDDYIKEYCAYGCAYFILENKNPKEIIFEEAELYKYKKRRKKRSPKSFDKSIKKNNEKDKKSNYKSKKDRYRRQKRIREDQLEKEEKVYNIKKRRKKNQQPKKKTANQVDSSSGKQQFKIRQKDEGQ